MNLIPGIRIVPFQPKHADGVNALFFETYGPSYPFKLGACVPNGAHYVVAVDEASEEPIGFARSRWLREPLAVSDAFPGVHEFGGYVVRRSFRGRGIGDCLSRMCEEHASREQAIHVFFSEPIGWDPNEVSQRIFAHHGFRPLGFSLLKYPNLDAAWHKGQPSTTVLVARHSRSSEHFWQRRRFLPADYEEFVGGTLLSGCYWEQYFLPQEMPPLVRHHVIEEEGITGHETGSELIDIPANWPEALCVIEGLRKEGWLFSGYLLEHGAVLCADERIRRFDYIRLYRPSQAFAGGWNWDLIRIIPEWVHLMPFFRAEHARVYG